MTVSYSADVGQARFCGLAKLLGRWRGSIYKILWREFLVFCLAFFALSATYRFLLNPDQKSVFEKVVIYVGTYSDMIPLSFVLGFYVSLVVGRWWKQYEIIPWPDRLAFMIASYVQGSDERSRMIRRSLGRYVILTMALTFQAVSTAVKKRFPTTRHFVTAGLMTKEEETVYEKISFVYGKSWLPAHWFCALATRARKEGRISDPVLLNGLFQEIFNYRTSCAIMFGYDWISVPLVYTQVVTLATYMYALALIIGRQYLDPKKGYDNNEVDLYVPFFTLIQFFFYMGWLKVAEQILNPYGEDDDDYELNWCLDRTVNLVYLSVDQLKMKHPKLSKDFFWDDIEPILPQTKTSAKYFPKPALGSAFYLEFGDAEYLPMDALFEQDDEGNVYHSDSLKTTRPSLLRRILSSGLGSRRRTPSRKRKSNKGTTQAFANPAFEVMVEKNAVGTRSAPVSVTGSLNNAVKTGTTQSHHVLFRPNSLSLHRRKYECLDAKTLMPPNAPAGRTLSAPAVTHQTDQADYEPEPEESAAQVDKTTAAEVQMPCIPEESSRAGSMDAGTLMNNFQKLHDVQHLVQEANKVLKELNKTSPADERSKGYESSSSEGSLGESSYDLSDTNLQGEESRPADVDKDASEGPQENSEPSLLSYRKEINVDQLVL